ncbi:WcbI family polysaccharide biosynthesis putative acetyltransferase [Butyrivibrio sp. WCD2001]|uniref:WcbI family polysaccharide biosynthesis putative acetyltransferase n=1 Tax=Butyrivibrio sp. WCD2001 TaxID=1280681 RepID=UPI0018CBAF62|nr:WcbI family polysaccharide biosynthesis putative acetyltransferase [Butyrivibrio sp. WCD2001]
MVEISGFIDSYVTGTTGSKSFDIMKPFDVLGQKKNYYIVAVSESKYFEIRDQLCAEGLVEFEDFIYWRLFKKEVVFLHGNCHMAVVRDMLYTSQVFTSKYGIYPLVFIQNMKSEISESLLRNVDVLISEDIQEDNRFGYEYSVAYLQGKIHRQKLIVIPNLFGMGKCFFPQFEWDLNHPIGKDSNGLFPHGDQFINKQLKNGRSIDDIGEQIKNGAPFSKEEVIDNFNDNVRKYRDREKYCDIKIIDFIICNYKIHQLFWDQGHPTNFVMNEIVTRLLKKIGIEDELLSVDEMNTHEEFVYPCVAQALELEWRQERIRCTKNAKKCTAYMDLDEYINEYVWWNSENIRKI